MILLQGMTHGSNNEKKGVTIMKFRHYFGVPFFGALALLGMTGCADEDIEGGKGNIPQGNGIVFGASASYAGPVSRVSYGDYDYAEGHEGDFNHRVSQEINWVEGDNVSIYSPSSPNQQQVDYAITGVGLDKDGNKTLSASHAYLASIGGQDGLQWARPNDTQDFYAVYPAKESMSNTAVKNLVSFEGGVLTGYVPINQQHTIVHNPDGSWTATPNYDYLYMAAINKGYKIPAADDPNGGVSLDFLPLTTTLEVTFVGPTVAPIAQFQVEANGVPVGGQFRCDLTQGNTTDADNYANNIPVCESLQQGTTNDYITVNTYYYDGDTQKPLSLAEGEEITFNVYLLPTADLNNVTIRVAGFNTSARTMSLDKVTFEPHKKVCVRVNAPEINAGGTNTWITGIEDDVLVSQLSIPGTANTFSYMYKGDNASTYSTQSATIEEQWKAGIRCFELTGEQAGSDGASLDGARLLCNREDIGMSFGDAVDEIWKLVQANAGEFAIIIPSYDSETGHPDDYNGVKRYANNLNKFFDDHTQYQYETFTRELTVGEARGKLIFIARITSEEDAGWNGLPTPHRGTFVDEWGSLKDNWARRGYAVNGTRVNNWATGETDQSSVEYYMHTRTTQNYGTTNTDGITAPVPGNASLVSAPTLSTDFVHSGTRADGSEGKAYIQDWQRVVPREGNYSGAALRPGSFHLGTDEETLWYPPYVRSYYHYYYWPESLTEKEKNIWDTFEASIEGNSKDDNDMFYINSLDGYFVDPSIEKSYKPYVSGGTWGVGLSDGGTEGNIEAYATHINNWFYNEILGYGEDNIYGPLNIVLMDRVYESDGGSYLPSTIINNNFRFPLRTKDGGTTQNQSLNASSSYASGGNVWK